MSRKHLLYWIFRWIDTQHVAALNTLAADVQMLSAHKDDAWIHAALHERIEAFRKFRTEERG